MAPNTREKLHLHRNAQQFFYVLDGFATFFSNEAQLVLGPGEGVVIKQEEAHYIANLGNENIEFLVISNPSTDSDRVDL